MSGAYDQLAAVEDKQEDKQEENKMPRPNRPCIVRCSPTAALIANLLDLDDERHEINQEISRLQRKLNNLDREARDISALLFEGRTSSTAKKFDEYVQQGLGFMRRELFDGKDLVVEVSTDRDFLLLNDQVRRFFDTAFSKKYLEMQLEDDLIGDCLALADDIGAIAGEVTDANAADEMDLAYSAHRETLLANSRTVEHLMKMFFQIRKINNDFANGALPSEDAYGKHNMFSPRGRGDKPDHYPKAHERGCLSDNLATREALRALEERKRFGRGSWLLRATRQQLCGLGKNFGGRCADRGCLLKGIDNNGQEIDHTNHPFVQMTTEGQVHAHVNSVSGGILRILSAMDKLYRTGTAEAHWDPPLPPKGRVGGPKPVAPKPVTPKPPRESQSGGFYAGDLQPDVNNPNNAIGAIRKPTEKDRRANSARIGAVFHAFCAMTVSVLGGHSLSEVLAVPHLSCFGGGLGDKTVKDKHGNDVPTPPAALSDDFRSMLHQAVGPKWGGTHGFSSMVRSLKGQRVPESVVEDVWDFIRAAGPSIGGMNLNVASAMRQACRGPAAMGAGGG